VVLQHNSLSECARRAARVAIVRGANSTVLTPLGPTAWTGTADQASPMNDAIRLLLVCMPFSRRTQSSANGASLLSALTSAS